jgi:hypothetical protein
VKAFGNSIIMHKAREVQVQLIQYLSLMSLVHDDEVLDMLSLAHDALTLPTNLPYTNMQDYLSNPKQKQQHLPNEQAASAQWSHPLLITDASAPPIPQQNFLA